VEHVAQRPAGHPPARLQVAGVEPQHVPDNEQPSARRPQDRLRVLDGGGERLLDEHRCARLQQRHGRLSVGVVWERHHRPLHTRPQQALQVTVDGHAEPLLHPAPGRGVPVHDPGQLHPRQAGQHRRVAQSHEPGPDHPDPDARSAHSCG
jgi:hypothetical protein